MIVIGVDPGLTGALALYDSEADVLRIDDMPTLEVTISKRKRKRVDATAVWEYFELAPMLGVELVMIEEVQAMPNNSGMFAFGWAAGLTYMACTAARLKVQLVRPQEWKKALNCRAKTAGSEEIMQRANEMFPAQRQLFYGPKGGKLVDRAEAAMIAKYATMTF